jgi:serine/threonine protein kinase
MGSVYLAEHAHLRRPAAIKMLSPHLMNDPTFRARFMREYEVVAALEHPNIVPIYDAGVCEGAPYIAMRYIDGGDLTARVGGEDRLPPTEAISAIRQVASALDAVHEIGVIHRDVKPANILVGHVPDGTFQYFLSDFGISRRVNTESSLTGTGQLIGTVNYIAPEQVEGTAIDKRADIYSLAATSYLLLTGQPVFVRSSDIATLWAHVRDEPLRPSQVQPELPAGVDRVLLRSLTKDPAERHPSCGAFAEDLHHALRPLIGRAHITVTDRGELIAKAISSSNKDQLIEYREVRTSTILRMCLIVLTLFAVSEFLAIYWNRAVAFALTAGGCLIAMGLALVIERSGRNRGPRDLP